IKTPTNIILQAWDMTPGLNMLHSRYRRELLNPDATIRAEAVGKMAVGGAIVGSAYTLAASGNLTGGGPSDPAVRKQWLASGWRPYSFRVPQADGSTEYVSYHRFDPIAGVFG